MARLGRIAAKPKPAPPEALLEVSEAVGLLPVLAKVGSAAASGGLLGSAGDGLLELTRLPLPAVPTPLARLSRSLTIGLSGSKPLPTALAKLAAGVV